MNAPALALFDAQEEAVYRPDYGGGSIVNLMASIVAARGGAPIGYEPLRFLPPEDIRDARSIVLLVVDGLGYRYLRRAGEGGNLLRHLKGSITSVFPTTTATAITSFLTGLAPQQHGLTGWHMYFRELGSILAVLPFRPRHGGPPLSTAGVDVRRLLGNAPVFERIGAPSWVVSPDAILDTDFNVAHTAPALRAGFSSRPEFFDAIRELVSADGGPRYVYAYYPDIDSLGHLHGIDSEAVHAELARFDAAFGRFLEDIAGTDTAVIVTADHGFVDTRPESFIDVSAHPELAGMLDLPLCGEPRVAYCYVASGRQRAFERYVQREFDGAVRLERSETLIDEGWFGIGAANPRLSARVGQYALVTTGDFVIKDRLPGEKPFTQIGVHGGVSAEEMLVPFMLARA